MALKLKCPECDTVVAVPDTAAGKQVRCASCQHVFVAKAAQAPKPSPTATPKNGVKAAPGKTNGPAGKANGSGVKTAAVGGKGSPQKPPAPTKKAGPPPLEDDDEDTPDGPPKKKKGSPLLMIFGIIGGVCLVLCLGCAGVVGYIYWSAANFVHGVQSDLNQAMKDAEEEAKKQQAQGGGGAVKPGSTSKIPGGFVDPFGPSVKITDINGALDAIKSNDKSKQQSGADWLAKQSLDPKRQTEVARALDGLVGGTGDWNARLNGVRAMSVWADKDSVPALIKAMEDDKEGWGNGTIRKEGFDTLVRLKDERGGVAIARYLERPIGGEDARKALVNMGPAAQKGALFGMNLPGDGAWQRARAVLAGLNTPPELMARQCLADAKDTNLDKRHLALRWLAESQKGSQEVAPDASKELAPLLTNSDRETAENACRALGIWGDKTAGPALMKVVQDPTMNDAADTMHRLAIEALGKIRDERAIPLVVSLMSRPNYSAAVEKAVSDFGAAAQPEIKKYLESDDKQMRADAARLLKKVGSKDNPELMLALNNLKSNDFMRRQEGAGWIAQQKAADKDKQAEVAAALEAALEDQDGGVRRQAAQALKIWATPDNSKGLIRALNQDDDGVRHPAIDTLGMLKEEMAIVPLCQLMTIKGGDRPKIIAALTSIGPKCEPTVLQLLGNQDKGVRIDACKVLQAVGTKASLPALNQLGTAAAAMKQNDVKNAAIAAITAIQSR